MAKATKGLTAVRFDNGEDRFVAYGARPKRLRVYEFLDAGHKRKPDLWYPDCLRFMPYAELRHQDDGLTLATIITRYGPEMPVPANV